MNKNNMLCGKKYKLGCLWVFGLFATNQVWALESASHELFHKKGMQTDEHDQDKNKAVSGPISGEKKVISVKDGGKLSYWAVPSFKDGKVGNTKGEVIVFLHGCPGNATELRSFYPFLSDYPLYAPDRMIQGRSRYYGAEGNHKTYMDQAVSDLKEFLDHIRKQDGVKKIILMGESIGTLMANHCMQTYSDEDIAGVILSAPTPILQQSCQLWKECFEEQDFFKRHAKYCKDPKQEAKINQLTKEYYMLEELNAIKVGQYYERIVPGCPYARLFSEYCTVDVIKSLHALSNADLQKICNKAGTVSNWNDAMKFLTDTNLVNKIKDHFYFCHFMVGFGKEIRQAAQCLNVKDFRNAVEKCLPIQCNIYAIKEKIKEKTQQIETIIAASKTNADKTCPFSDHFIKTLEDENGNEENDAISDSEIQAIETALNQKFQESGDSWLNPKEKRFITGMPVLMLRGEHDFLPDNVAAIKEYYEKSGAKVTVKRFEGAGHGIDKSIHRDEYFEEIKKFVKKSFD